MRRPTHLRVVASEIHGLGCTCPTCEPYVPSLPRFARAAQQTWALMMIGFVVGVLAVVAVNGLRPTFSALFGL